MATPSAAKLAREHVLGEVRDLAEMQIGRARADLQYRLREATRTLIPAVERRYTASTDRLVSALQTAAALREHADGQAQRRLAELVGREQALRSVLARLDPADWPAAWPLPCSSAPLQDCCPPSAPPAAWTGLSCRCACQPAATCSDRGDS